MKEEEYIDDQFDYATATQELKKALFEICKTEFDRSPALDRLIIEHGPLVVDVFSENPFETMPALEDFYDCNDYEDPEDGMCMSFADWSEFFADKARKELSQYIFDQLTEGASVESVFNSLEAENPNLSNLLSIRNPEDIKEFMARTDYEDNLLGVEQSLSDWKSFFDNDEFGLYKTCNELTKQNLKLTQKIEEIKNIIEK